MDDHAPEAAARTGQRSAWLTALGIGVAIGTLLLGGVALMESRWDAWQQARQSAGNLLLALDRDIGRNISLVDLSLQGLQEALAEPGIEDVSPAIRNHALFDRSASAEDLGSMLVLDAKGTVIADSTSTAPHHLDLGDRDYFTVHEQDPDLGMFISRAFRSRLSNGDPRFAISRRLDGPGGEFKGVVLATLRLNYLRRLFEKLDIGANGTIALLRTDGRLLYRYPFRPQDFDVDVSQRSASFERFKKVPSGEYVAVAALDGVERLYSFRHVGNLPLILTVSLSTEEIFAPWWPKALVIGSVMVLLCAAAVASSLLFRREMVRREASERALATANQQLSVLATTDGLTGLMNRRAFDQELDRAFRSCVRNGRTLSALMMDADQFKRFNDTYGHIAGDDVLRSLAACIRSNLRRPDDRGARFGGEEFVAILPDTDGTAAIQLAERIRESVKSLGIPHAGSPTGIVSISIGVGVMVPMIDDRAEQLLQLADQGLYMAKSAGRDCVRATCEPARSGLGLNSASLVPATRHKSRSH